MGLFSKKYDKSRKKECHKLVQFKEKMYKKIQFEKKRKIIEAFKLLF